MWGWISLTAILLVTSIGLGITASMLWQNIVSLRLDHDEQKRQYNLMTIHIDQLIRHFHLTESPYVVEKLEKGLVMEGNIRCWHCKMQQAQGHTDACPWGYIDRKIKYVDNMPTLREVTKYQ